VFWLLKKIFINPFLVCPQQSANGKICFEFVNPVPLEKFLLRKEEKRTTKNNTLKKSTISPRPFHSRTDASQIITLILQVAKNLEHVIFDLSWMMMEMLLKMKEERKTTSNFSLID
jgi:hypothetical protein